MVEHAKRFSLLRDLREQNLLRFYVRILKFVNRVKDILFSSA